MNYSECDSTAKDYCESFLHSKGCKYIKECTKYPTLWKTDQTRYVSPFMGKKAHFTFMRCLKWILQTIF